VRVGIGLPNAIPGTDGALLVEWARRAEEGPFTSLGVLDRIPYGSADPFVSLAAAAATTRRIGLVTMVAIGPLRSTVLLAKRAASVHALSDGRRSALEPTTTWRRGSIPPAGAAVSPHS
jgi:alkanesulfonate monooxygenase SsuD/methylene tetrahydromethanopterin reductase-like flavin-dependent oxidoreductase (luciferase family)